MLRASQLAWVCDDAYISFRYARNLLQSGGLDFNSGERVEGYTNFLWTLWSSLGMRLGVSAEAWSMFWGVVCHGATLAILCGLAYARARRLGIVALPVAAALAALHRDWAIYGTSGLETSLLTLLLTAGYAVLVLGAVGPVRAAGAGALFALAILTRPDALLFAVVAGLFVQWAARPRWPATLAYCAVLLALCLPWIAWKWNYYGSLLPNTYFAKSAYRAWYGQGFVYVALYFAKYWVLLCGFALLGVWTISRMRARVSPLSPPEFIRPACFAGLGALAYVGYVMRVGGDFMYARMLIPATPFLIILFEVTLERLTMRRTGARAAVAVLALAGIVVSPGIPQGQRIRGIGDEWEFYRAIDHSASKGVGQRLHGYFHDLPVRIAFTGTQAILVYYSEVSVAIESETGLTDSFIAHQTLPVRGRPGHEKHAPWSYLIESRRVHFILGTGKTLSDTLSAYIPFVPVIFGDYVATVLSWDPAVMDSLSRRGASFPDFVAALDEYVRTMPGFSDSTVNADYLKFRRFYFGHVNDPSRESAFLERLGGRKTIRESAASAPSLGFVPTRERHGTVHRRDPHSLGAARTRAALHRSAGGICSAHAGGAAMDFPAVAPFRSRAWAATPVSTAADQVTTRMNRRRLMTRRAGHTGHSSAARGHGYLAQWIKSRFENRVRPPARAHVVNESTGGDG